MKPKLSFALGVFFKGDDDDDEGGADDDDDRDADNDDEGGADDDDIGAGPLDLAKLGSLKKSPFLNGKNYGNDKMTTTTLMMRANANYVVIYIVCLIVA